MAEEPIEMAHEQLHHRQGLEKRVIFHDVILRYLGLIVGAAIVLMGMWMGYHLIQADKPAGGSRSSDSPQKNGPGR